MKIVFSDQKFYSINPANAGDTTNFFSKSNKYTTLHTVHSCTIRVETVLKKFNCKSTVVHMYKYVEPSQNKNKFNFVSYVTFFKFRQNNFMLKQPKN